MVGIMGRPAQLSSSIGLVELVDDLPVGERRDLMGAEVRAEVEADLGLEAPVQRAGRLVPGGGLGGEPRQVGVEQAIDGGSRVAGASPPLDTRNSRTPRRT